jgi:hypothetical protein
MVADARVGPPWLSAQRGAALRKKLGDDRHDELHAQGGDAPVVDVVHRTRSALLGQARR